MKKENNLNLTCHTRPDRVPRGMIFNNKEYHTAGFPLALRLAGMTESGRSIFEMLGVLAVMGVISIGGVYGYTKAMERHRANELLNEANKRAVMVASQFMAGRDPESVKTEEFPEETPYGTFSANITSDGNDKFKMTVSGLDEKTCDLLKSFTGGPLRRVSCQKSGTSFTAELFFNKDLSTTEKASDFNGNKSACEADSSRQYCAANDTCISATETCPSTVACNGHGYKDSNDDCVCDPGYNGTDCATAACTTGTYCGSGATKECCATDEVCTTSGDVAGTCVKNSSGCTTNASCNDATKYCKLENTDYECEAPNKGTCTTLDAGRETTYENGTNKKTFLVSSDTMSWWAADNWCKAHDMKLVSYNTVNRLFDCDKNSKKCTWSKFTTSGNWSNGTLPDYYWTAESYDSCNAWYVFVASVDFYYNSRDNSATYYAMCE